MSDKLKSLEQAVVSANTSAEKAAALNLLAEYLTDSDPNRAITVAKEAGQIARAISDQVLFISSLLNAAWALHNLADYAGSVTQALEALKLAQQHKHRSYEFDALNILGNNHQVVGNRPDALQSFMQALKLAEAMGFPNQMATVQNNIGLVYEGMEDYAAALKYYQQALTLYRETNASAIMRSIAGVNVAESYNHLGLHAEALVFARESAAVAAEADFGMGEALALTQAGNAYGGLGQFDEAARSLAQAMSLIQKVDAPYQKAVLLKASAQLHMKQGDIRASIALQQEALAIFEMLEANPSIFPIHKNLAQAYASLGDYQQAFHHMEGFHEVKERVFNEQADSREKTLQAMFEVDKARLEADNQRHRSVGLQQEIEQNEAIIAELDSYADNVAHDLKNPIGLIIGFADLIQSDSDNQLSEISRECLDNLRAAADKLNEIVSALLSLARARKQEIMSQPVDMTAVLHETMQRLHPVIERAGAVLDVPTSLPSCQGHASWLEEALVNYMSNAIKYGGSPPHVRVDASIEPDGMITYRVTDNGRGLSPEEQQALFRKFERLGQQKIEGTGLGLMIVKAVVEKLGGRVAVSSPDIPGQGTTFSFTLRPTQEHAPITD